IADLVLSSPDVPGKSFPGPGSLRRSHGRYRDEIACERAAPFGHGLLTQMDAPASGLAVRRLAVHRVAEADRMLHKAAAPTSAHALTLAMAPVLPVDEALRRLDSTEAGLNSDGPMRAGPGSG